MVGAHGAAGWMFVNRRLFRPYGIWVALELSCLETLLSLDIDGSREDIRYDEIDIMIIKHNCIFYYAVLC